MTRRHQDHTEWLREVDESERWAERCLLVALLLFLTIFVVLL